MLAVVMAAAAGCASTSTQGPDAAVHALPQLEGSYYEIQPGDTLWRIAHAFGMTVERLAAANQIASPSALGAGQRLFIPLPEDTPRFLWPVHGAVQRPEHGQGVALVALEGTPVRAARSGIVAAAVPDVPGWGRTLILEHGDDYFSVYAGLSHVVADPGAPVRQGAPIGLAGAEGVYFEIRHGVRSQDPLTLLP